MKELRNDWTLAEVEALFTLPFNDLLLQAHIVISWQSIVLMEVPGENHRPAAGH